MSYVIFGLSAKDVKDFHDKFDLVVDELTKSGQRMSPGAINNINRSLSDLTGGKYGEPYLGCWEQADKLLDGYSDQSTEDTWNCKIVSRLFPFPHSWVECTSSIPSDPLT